MKKLLLSLATLFCAMSVSAGTASFNFNQDAAYGMTVYSGNTTSYETTVTKIADNNVTLDFSGNYRLWQATNNYELRFNKNSGAFTVTAPEGNKISKIEFTGTKTLGWTLKSGETSLTENTDFTTEGTGTAGTFNFSPNLSAITFTAGSASRVDVQTMTVTFEAAAPTEKKPCGLKFSPASLECLTSEVIGNENLPVLENPNNLTYTTTFSDAEFEGSIVEGKLVFTKVPTAAAKCTVTCAFEGNDQFEAGQATFTLTTISAANNFAEALAACQADASANIQIAFESTVVYVNGANIYLVDAQGNPALVYSFNNGYNTGDVIPEGWNVVYSPYNGLPEFKPSGTLPAATASGKEITYPVVEASALETTELNTVCIVNNVVFDAETPSSKNNFTGKVDNVEIPFRWNFTGVEAVEPGKYNVTLAVACYNTNRQYYPIAYERVTEEIPDLGITPIVYLNGERVNYTTEPNDLWGSGNQYVANPVFNQGETVTVKIDYPQGYILNLNLNKDHTIYNGEFTITDDTIIDCYTYLADWAELSERVLVTVKFEEGVGVNSILENGNAVYFDLQGRRVVNPAAGMYIRVENGKTQKVSLK